MQWLNSVAELFLINVLTNKYEIKIIQEKQDFFSSIYNVFKHN
jgi:hypothetical protein